MTGRITAALLSVLLLAAPAHAANSTLPELSCASALLMEKETGTILYEQDSHKQLPPASVTKIMTLLLVMEAIEEGVITTDETVTVSSTAAGMGGSQVYLKQGEQMRVGDLLKCVAVVSGNDCAVALAEHLAGSETAFVSRMNERAAELGMTDTTFLNCTGLPVSGHVTSAHDIALMSRELIRNHPDIRAYTTIWMDSIRNGEFGLTNTNRLIRFYAGATGLKTGSTDEALYCMSATAERDGMELIAVVMKSPTTLQRFNDAQTLLDYGFAGWSLAHLHPDAPLPTVDVLLGSRKQVQSVLRDPCTLLVEKGEKNSLTTRVELCENVQAPVEEGQILGEMLILSGETVRTRVPIVASEEVPRRTVGDVMAQLLRILFMCEP